MSAFSAAVVGDRLGQRITATCEQIAALAGRPPERVQAVLDTFSQPLRGPGHSGGAALRDFLQGRNAWRLSPLIATTDKHRYAVDTGLLFGLREVVERGLPERARAQYVKHTATWMENSAADALAAVLRPDSTWRKPRVHRSPRNARAPAHRSWWTRLPTVLGGPDLTRCSPLLRPR
jgi:hypothetical protein